MPKKLTAAQTAEKSRTELLAGLERVRDHLCAYVKPPCDCKFGATRVGQHSEEGSGCPEVATAKLLLSLLTPKEWMRLLRRRWSGK